MSAPLTPAQARIKRKVRQAIHQCGGVDGAAATAERGRSVAGDWGNLNHPAFPPLECAHALDEACIAQGQVPPILSALAAELGHVVIRLPDCGEGVDALTGALIDASAEFGDIATEVREATRDGNVNAAERDRIIAQIDQAFASIARLRAVVAGEGTGLKAVASGG